MNMTSKQINKFTAIVASIFFVVAVFSALYETNKQNVALTDLQTLVNNVNEYNNNLNVETQITDTTKAAEEFKGAREAFYSAYYGLYNQPSYCVKTFGTMTTLINIAVKIEINTLTEYTLLKYEDGAYFLELITFTTKGAEYRKSSSTIFYYDPKDDNVYIRKTTDVYIEGVTSEGEVDLAANYISDWIIKTKQEFFEESGIILGGSLYDFRLTNLVTENQFTVVKNPRTKETESYIVNIESNPSRSAELYARIIDYLSFSSKPAEMTKVTQSAEIDAQGNLINMNIKEEFHLSVIEQGIQVPVSGKSESTYYIFSINKPIEIEKPNINNN